MAKKIERTYATTISKEEITMDKYTQLLKDIARLIVDTDRDRFLLSVELESAKAQLEAAESKIAHNEKELAAAHERIETLVARNAVQMMQEDAANA